MKLLVIIPYRNRENHLYRLIPHITNILNHQKINFKIIIVEQNEGKLFNRGLLCNIGFHIYSNNYEYVIFHDVDMICDNIDYTYSDCPTSLLRYRSKHNYRLIHDHYFGGITLFPNKDFITINGFSNEYWGWGAEDDDLRIRCAILNLSIKNKSGKCLDLETDSKKNKIQENKNYQNNLNKLNSLIKIKNINMIKHDGLSNVNKLYTIKHIISNKLFSMVKVEV